MTDDPKLTQFLRAAADLLEVALRDGLVEDRSAAAGLQAMLRAGGMATISATLSPVTKTAWLAVEVIEPSGTRHQLMRAELRKAVLQ